MSGRSLIKQAVIAALCEHPEADKYKARAFEGENLSQIQKDLATGGRMIVKEDLFTPDENGTYIIDTPGFWRNFNKIVDLLSANDEKFEAQDFLRDLDRPDRNLLKCAEDQGGLEKLFSPTLWTNRYEEMEYLWFKTTYIQRQNAFDGGGLLSVKRKIFAAEGRKTPEDKLADAGIDYRQIPVMFSENGLYDDIKRKLNQNNDHMRKEYLLLPDNTGDTMFAHAVTWEYYDHLVRDMAKNDEQFEVNDFLVRNGNSLNILSRASENNALPKIFTADHWVNRLDDMLELWENVLDAMKSQMDDQDFDRAFAEAEDKTYSQQVALEALQTKSDVMQPIGDSAQKGKAVLPLGLRSFWRQADEILGRLETEGQKLSMDDLRQKSGQMENSCMVVAIKAGRFDKVLDISRQSKEGITLDDFLSCDRHGNKVVDILAERGELEQALKPDIWAGRVSDLQVLLKNVDGETRMQINVDKVLSAAKVASTRKMARNLPRPKRPGAKGSGPKL